MISRQVFSNSQWAVKPNYHCVVYQLKIGRLDLEFLGRIPMSVSERTLTGLEELPDSQQS